MSNETNIELAADPSDIPSQETVIFPKRDPRLLAWRDMKDGLFKWHIWLMLAYQDIKLRYRRSVLGPFWITLSMAITVYSMGFLYSHLFHTDLQSYFPFLVGGMVTWALISSQVSELTDTFVVADGLIKQLKLPYSLYVHRVAMRNILIFFHNMLVIVPILAIFHEVAKVNLYTLLLIPGLLFVYINSISFGMVLAMIGARYRDISQVIKSLIQVIFFLTPVMWRPDVLSEKKRFVVLLNPFSSFIEIVRSPLIGRPPAFHDVVMVLGVTLVGFLISYKMFVRYRSRIVYWL
ncbi:MAG: ABC transporter permease [Gammaproteobacteria bacterium]|nr:MAG: ABC transporter permease [Gammaproteobacteria bacterium]